MSRIEKMSILISATSDNATKTVSSEWISGYIHEIHTHPYTTSPMKGSAIVCSRGTSSGFEFFRFTASTGHTHYFPRAIIATTTGNITTSASSAGFQPPIEMFAFTTQKLTFHCAQTGASSEHYLNADVYYRPFN